MEYQRRPSAVSQLSFSDTELNLLEENYYSSELFNHSHFFAPSSQSNQRYSTPLILISPENSTHNSTSSIPSSLATTATNSTHSSTTSPPPLSSPSSQGKKKPKKFSLNLNGHLTPPPPPLFSPSQFVASVDSPDLSKGRLVTGRQRGDEYINKESLANDLSSLASMPELCDVTFLVGEDRQPVCGVRAILAARSRVFRKMLFIDTTVVIGAGKKSKKKHQIFRPSDGYIEKYDFRGQPTVVVRDFEIEVFKLLIDYIHTGTVILQTRTLLGLMNASDHYALEELKQACIRFTERCISIDTVCSLLSSAEKYIQYKSTKILVQKIFEYVDLNAEVILKLLSFQTLPQHVVRIVLSREELKASESTKFEAAYKWCLSNIGKDAAEKEIKALFEPFVDVINYNHIPAKELMQKVKPTGVVEDSYILTALAFQADPSSVPLVKKGPGFRINSTSAIPLEENTRKKQVPLRFRRVQSSGNGLGSFSNMQRSVSEDILQQSRDARSGSVPVNSDNIGEPGGSGCCDDDDGFLFMRGGSSDVHPLRAHHVKDHRMGSQSSSHLSILSSPALSPMDSPTIVNYGGSFLSCSSSDSVPVSLSPGGNSSSSCQSQPSTIGGDGGGDDDGGGVTGGGGASGVTRGDGGREISSPTKKKMSYNPHTLDTIVSLSSTTNAVEV